MNTVDPKIKKNFGFGCMRLPTVGEEVDIPRFTEMVDAFMGAGFNYFDTAHVYHRGKSEPAMREALVKRYPRESFVFTNKLSGWCFKTEEEILPLFESQLEACGVDYFDFYLMHAQGARNFDRFKSLHAYEIAFRLKEEGRVKHVGISFHDTAEMLERILTEYPQIEVVQLQFNYADFEDPVVQSRLCYEVCVRHGKPVIVMEPVRGGALAGKLSDEARGVLDALHGGSPASYALRFAAGFENVMMVLSGMSDMDQVEDNLKVMGNFEPLNAAERAAVEKVGEMVRMGRLIPCTACRYCVDGCPKSIPIPELFTCLNTKRQSPEKVGAADYAKLTEGRGLASECIRCGKCEESCPQHLKIRDHLEDVAVVFEKR